MVRNGDRAIITAQRNPVSSYFLFSNPIGMDEGPDAAFLLPFSNPIGIDEGPNAAFRLASVWCRVLGPHPYTLTGAWRDQGNFQEAGKIPRMGVRGNFDLSDNWIDTNLPNVLRLCNVWYRYPIPYYTIPENDISAGAKPASTEETKGQIERIRRPVFQHPVA